MATHIYTIALMLFIKKLFSPSIIFYIIKEPENEVHILRVLREERDWENILEKQHSYTYPK